MACLALYLCNRVRRCVNNKAGDRTTVRSPCAACACACAHIVDVASDSDSFNGKNKTKMCPRSAFRLVGRGRRLGNMKRMEVVRSFTLRRAKDGKELPSGPATYPTLVAPRLTSTSSHRSH